MLKFLILLAVLYFFVQKQNALIPAGIWAGATAVLSLFCGELGVLNTLVSFAIAFAVFTGLIWINKNKAQMFYPALAIGTIGLLLIG